MANEKSGGTTFGLYLRGLRNERNMTIRELGEAASQDYVTLNKVELGLRMAPPLEVIIALADALSDRKPVRKAQMNRLLELAAQPNDKAGARFRQDELERLKGYAKNGAAFFKRRGRKRK